MAFYRVYSSKDTYITNQAIGGLAMTGSNYGSSPVLEVFANTPGVGSDGNVSPNPVDLSRILLYFDTTQLSSSIVAGTIPSVGVQYVLNLFNLVTDKTLPSSFDLEVIPLTLGFDEGTGIDTVNAQDSGEANWVLASSVNPWSTAGGDYSRNYGVGTQHFDVGNENLSIDITTIVSNWLNGVIPNNGLLLKFTNAEESIGGYFLKAFSSRESMYVDEIPFLEARWNDVQKDNRGNFLINQPNSLYLYNFVRGELANLPGIPTVTIQDGFSASVVYSAPAALVSKGVYSASFMPTSAGISSSWVDFWSSGSYCYMTGNFNITLLTGSQANSYDEFDVNIANLNRVYSTSECARLNVVVTDKNYVTHVGILSSASLNMTPQLDYMEKMYYTIVDDNTGETVVPYGTGSIPYTQTSYDANGNYFTLNMRSFVPGFVYRIKLLIAINKKTEEFDEDFLFKVV
jgi:hypothetical protein